MSNTSTIKQKILSLADHCVKCGLCSSQCPTYLLRQDENESPRGRIALAQALASDAMRVGNKASLHLNNCLQCRRCEAVCPSEVKYGELINYTSELLLAQNQSSNRWYISAVSSISRLSRRNWQKIAKLLHVFSYTGLIQLLRLSKSGRHLLRFLPKNVTIAQNSQETTNTKNTSNNSRDKKTAFLFTGCLSHIFDEQSLQACLGLLQHCGYAVKIPEKQTCCGAIAARQGLSNIDQECQLNNQLAFSDPENTPILFFTTGCGGKLKEYREQLPSEVSFADRVFDITQFLANSELFAKLTFSPLNKKVLIFSPCSERNVLKQSGIVKKLLERIPGIEIVNLPKFTGCCGASGSHLFTHQQQADEILAPLLDQILAISPDIIVSPNYPCNLHIQSGLQEKNLDIAMIHPIELLFNQVKMPE